MNVKALYHTPESSLKLLKSLGFTHWNLTLWNYPDLESAVKAHQHGHDEGLHAIVSDQIVNEDWIESKKRTMKAIFHMRCKAIECIAYLYDEPNVRGIHPSTVNVFNKDARDIGYRTACVLGWTKSYRGYWNCADYIGFNFYKTLTLSRKISLAARIKAFQLTHKTFIWAVPAVKPGIILGQFDFWQKWIKPNGYYWYPYTCDQEGERFPDGTIIPGTQWASKDFSQLSGVQHSFGRINQESAKSWALLNL